MGTLFVVATPIGNLKDITLRALEALKSADIVLAEDTRVAKKLLAHYAIEKPVWRADAKAEREIGEKIVAELEAGKAIAFVSDAGTPNVSDPGAFLVAFVREHAPNAGIVSVPGPSALAAFLSICGVRADRFTFLGYPPHKKGRETFFKDIPAIVVRPLVLYESPHRLGKTFKNLVTVFGSEAAIVVGKELTKIHEEIWRGSIADAKGYFAGEKGKGEFVLLIE